jgi:hypothetical protein
MGSELVLVLINIDVVKAGVPILCLLQKVWINNWWVDTAHDDSISGIYNSLNITIVSGSFINDDEFWARHFVCV